MLCKCTQDIFCYTYLITDKCTFLPFAFLAYTTGYGYCCNTPWLCAYYFTIFTTTICIIQYILWNLSKKQSYINIGRFDTQIIQKLGEISNRYCGLMKFWPHEYPLSVPVCSGFRKIQLSIFCFFTLNKRILGLEFTVLHIRIHRIYTN